MDFYSSISEKYDNIFSRNQNKANFVLRNLKPDDKKILDIGCGTGEVLRILNKKNSEIDLFGIDFNKKMIEKALEKKTKANFMELDMLKIDKEFSDIMFDMIYCFGNTLVHLEDFYEIRSMFIKMKEVSKKGTILIQILNYDNIIENNIRDLPLIENEDIKFQRSYKELENGKLLFETKLTNKKSNKITKNAIELYPLRKDELEQIFTELEFRKYEFYSSFHQDPYDENSYPLICKIKI